MEKRKVNHDFISETETGRSQGWSSRAEDKTPTKLEFLPAWNPTHLREVNETTKESEGADIFNDGETVEDEEEVNPRKMFKMCNLKRKPDKPEEFREEKRN
ncbi:hypothetical protein RUM43_009446 [Polyplax serrata]|uniref:Uncharacterized protein n=1 Tax=Polyplax serrata TaxID=468196 RepID=A0AAN8PWE1_POLSC